MRQVTATEKYLAVLEGKMAKKEFVRQMRQSYPMYISNYDGFDSTVQILRTRKMLFEAPQKAFSGVKVYDDRPALTYSLDALDRGIRYELQGMGFDPAINHITHEQLQTATKKAKDNLEKDANHYLNLLSGESSKVDKHDREEEVKRGEGKKDVFNGEKKADLKESVEEINVAGHDIRQSDEKQNIISVAREIRAKYGEIPGFNGLLKDFLQTHMDDVKSGNVTDPIAEFDDFVDLNYDRLDEKEEEEEVEINTDADFEREQRAQLAGRNEEAVTEMTQDAIDALIGVIGAGGLTGGAIALSRLLKALESGKLGEKGKAVADYLAKAGAAAASSTQKHEAKGKNHEGEKEMDDVYGDGDVVVDITGLSSGMKAVWEIEKEISEFEDSNDAQTFVDTMAKINSEEHLVSFLEDRDLDIQTIVSMVKAYNSGSISEKKGKDHDGDGDIDSDDYMMAKDKAIKKAMGKKDEQTHPEQSDDEFLNHIQNLHQANQKRPAKKKYSKDEQIKEAVKGIIRKVLNEGTLNEAATNELARLAEDYEGFDGMKQTIVALQNIVTEIESFYDKTRDKIQKVYDSIGEVRNEEGLKVGGFLAPAIEAAFNKDLRPVVKHGFTKGLDTPKVRMLSKADIDAHNSGDRPLGEEDKQTVFTPVNENKK